MDITRSDLSTPRGIRVGDSREEVLSAYPEAAVNNYWGNYPEDPPLCWYAWPEMDIGPDILGPAILFFFEGDTLRQITVTNMFD